MNKIYFSVILLLCVAFVLADLSQWNKFKQRNGKSKKYNAAEDKLRYAQFKKTSKRVNECNAAFKSGKIGYSCDIHSWADMLPNERKSMRGMNVSHINKRDIDYNRRINYNGVVLPIFVASNQIPLPATFDVRTKCKDSKCTDCKTQINQNIPQGCGNCYAISAVRVLQYAMCYQLQICDLLSVQETMDCTYNYNQHGNHGCDGGLAPAIFELAKKKGISTAKSYPFHATDPGYNQRSRSCDASQQDSQSKKKYVKEFFYVEPKVVAIKEALYLYGSLAIGIDAQDSFSDIKENNWYEGRTPRGQLECGPDSNHAMTLLGWDVHPQTQKQYWVIENSWGCEYGKNGVLKLLIDETNNLCGQLSSIFGVKFTTSS